jgi:uncharacterized repeat protein (TIGR01451 family)
MMLTNSLLRRRATSCLNKRGACYAFALLLAAQLPALALAQVTTIVVTSTASDRGTFTELQCLPPGSDVDPGPGSTTVTGGATLAAAMADGVVTLREAICVANNLPGPAVIVLSPATYTLSEADNYWYGPNGLPPIGNDITIEGNGAVIRRNPANSDTQLNERFRFFFVSRRTLTDGIAIRDGADRAQLTLRNLTLRNGLARGGAAENGGGGAGMGGAIFNQGQLHLERVSFLNNDARGGRSGRPGWGQPGGGGGIGQDARDGGGFGPGLFGGALGGSSLFDPSTTAFPYGCGGGAGFGLASGGNAAVHRPEPALPDFAVVFAGTGGGLGNVGGSVVPVCDLNTGICGGEGRDGGGGGTGAGSTADSTDGDGGGGGFGLAGSPATNCSGGGGVGGGGGGGILNRPFGGGSGGFGAGGGTATIGGGRPSQIVVGGAGGFGGGGGAGYYEPDPYDVIGPGGFGGGDGGVAGSGWFGYSSGGGGAGMGGALFNHGGNVSARNTTWSGNRAIGGGADTDTDAAPGAGLGGAIFNLDGVLELSHSTLSGNHVARELPTPWTESEPAGGALYHRVQNPDVYGFAPSVTVRASILANSLDEDGLPISDCNHSAHPDTSVSSELSVSEFNLFETLSIIPNWPVAHSACALGAGSMLTDPQLQALADNGGLTPTMALPLGSPALDAAGPCVEPATDQRGVPRPQGAACDIGAFEREVLQCPAGGVFFVDQQAAAGGNGTSWASAFSDLQEALAVFGSCEIWVAAGVYKPSTDPTKRGASFRLRSGVAIYGGFAGTETARDQRDPQTHMTVLSGDIDNNDSTDADGVVLSQADIVGANSYNVLVGVDLDATAVLDGFTITAGLATGATSPALRGGGMHLSNSSPTLNRIRFSGNRASSDGGALYLDGGNPSLAQVGFSGNHSGSRGGALFSMNGSPVLVGVDFTGNEGSIGGGLAVQAGAPSLTDVGFTGNVGGSGGGMRVDQSFAELTNVRFSGNQAQNGGGLSSFLSFPTLTNVSFSGNRAGFLGGGMINERGNAALTNVSFSGNHAQNRGGGFANVGPASQPTHLTLRNAVFWNNRDSTGTGTASASIHRSGTGSTADIGQSLVQGCNPGGTWTADCGSDGGSNLADADPQFVSTPDPALAPSAAGDLRLRARSPAIDAGDNSLNATALDLAGNARVFGGTIDLGPFETPYLGVSLSTAGSGSGSAELQAPLPPRFDPGDEVIVAATAASNSDFGGWSGDLVASDNPLTFAISADTALTANFPLKTFEVTSTVIGNGSITPPSQSIEFEGTASFTVTPAIGWSLVSVSGEPCNPVNTGGNSWQADNIVADCAIEAVFSINSYAMTASTASGQGSISPDSQSVDHGGNASFTVTPETGWSVASVDGDTCTPEDQGEGSWVAANITQECAVEAVFSINSYAVTASTSSGQGSISPDSQSVDHSGNASFTVTPETGWSVASVDGDTCTPEDQGEGLWIAANITEDCSVLANFTAVAADLQIAKDSGVDAVMDGQVLVYAITVANAGPAAVIGAQLSDTLPATLVDAEWACLPEASNTACPAAPFDAGSGDLYAEIDLPVDGFLRYDLSARVQADGGTLVSNTATVTLPDGIDELDPSNNSATDETLIEPEGIFVSGFEAGPSALTVPAAAKAQQKGAGR